VKNVSCFPFPSCLSLSLSPRTPSLPVHSTSIHPKHRFFKERCVVCSLVSSSLVKVRSVRMIPNNPCSNSQQQVQDYGRDTGPRSDLPGRRPDHPHFPTSVLLFVPDGFPTPDGTSLLMFNDRTCRLRHVALHGPGSSSRACAR